MNGYIGIPEKVNENVGTQKIGMAEKVPWMVVYGLRAFHRNPGGKPDYRESQALLQMGCCGCCRKKEQKLDVAFSKHKCTDVICLALFGAVWFVTIIIFLAAGRTADTAA